MRRLFLLFLLLLPLLTSGTALAQSSPNREAILPAFRVEGLDERPGLEKEIRRMAAEARRRIRRRTDKDWEGTATVLWLDEQAFLERTNFRPEHTAAAADWRNNLILINASAWNRSSAEERQKVMTHEVAHLLIGHLAGGPDIPLWTNEGLAMHLAGQWTLDDFLNVSHVYSTTGLPRLAWLETEFPDAAPSRTLAYQTSYLAVAALARLNGDDPGSVRQLIRRLSHPNTANPLTRQLRDPDHLALVEAEMVGNIGSRVSAGVIAVMGGGFLLVLASMLVIVAFIKVKNRQAARLREEEDEEPWAESLSEADVQEIYGDREDRWDEDKER